MLVSTDDPEIAEISRSFGAITPFERTAKNADDQSTLQDVIKEVLLKYKQHNKNFAYFCCILPTAPFVTHQRITEGFELLKKTSAISVVPVTRFGYPIQRALRVEATGILRMFWPDNYNARSQDLEPAYHDAGRILLDEIGQPA